MLIFMVLRLILLYCFGGHFKALLKVTIVEAAMHVCSCILFMSGTETTFGSIFKA